MSAIIDELVALIRQARYGRDVRESIAQGIETIDDVAEGARDSATASATASQEYAQQASQQASNAQTYAGQASGSATEAESWAVGGTGTRTGEDTDNAKYYAESIHPGVANGVATLDATGRVPYNQLPKSAVEYKGTWNANTNTPTLTQGVGTHGDFYLVDTAGTWDSTSFNVGDQIIFDEEKGTTGLWVKLSGGNVISVNGKVGTVVLNAPDIPFDPTGTTMVSTETAAAIKEAYNHSSSGGHEIKNQAGTSLPQRSGMEFTDAKLSDDSTNDVTKIELFQEVTKSQLDNLGANTDGFYQTTDEGEDEITASNLIYTGNETVKTALDKRALQSDLTDISVTGSTNTTGSTITSGTFFYLDEVLVRAKTDIASNATFTLNTNYEAVTAGGLNAINSDLSANPVQLWSDGGTLIPAGTTVTIPNIRGYRYLIVRFVANTNEFPMIIPVNIISSSQRYTQTGFTGNAVGVVTSYPYMSNSVVMFPSDTQMKFEGTIYTNINWQLFPKALLGVK